MEGDPSPVHSPGSKQAQASCDIFNVPENVKLAYIPVDEHLWTPEMEQAQREQNRRLEEEEERARQEVLRHEAEEKEENQPLSAIVLEPKTPVAQSSTDGLRYVCDCDIEGGSSALYYRKIKRPALTSEREGRYPWLLGWFRGLYVSCPNYGGVEDTFKAAVVNQMLKALERCEQDGHQIDGPRDPVLLDHLGTYIEYTPITFPPPWIDDFHVRCSEFCGSQATLARHLHAELGTDHPPPRERPTPVAILPPPLPPPPPPLPPPPPTTLPQPQQSAAPPKEKPKPQKPKQTKPTGAVAVTGPPPAIQLERPEILDLPPPPPVKPPSPEEEQLEDYFLDDDPTDNDSFETMAWTGYGDEAKSVACNHSLFASAVQDYRIQEPKKYCSHVRSALAKHIIRHPDKWGVAKRDCELLSVLASLGYIKKEITTQARMPFPELDYEDRAPLYDLQQLYNVEVSNRFEALVSEPDMLDLTAEDVAEEVQQPAQAAQRAGKRRPPSAKSDAPEKQRRRVEREAFASKAEAQQATKTPEERRRNAKAAMRRIVRKISDIKVSVEQVAMAVLRQDRAPQVDRLFQEWHPWLRYPTMALQKGLICWLAACKFNQVKRTTAMAMVCKRMHPLSSLCTSTGPRSWVRDLTQEGVEPNPGPGISAPTTPPTDSVEPFSAWTTDRADVHPSTLTAARKYVEKALSFPAGVARDVNYAVIAEAYWFAAQENDIYPFKVPTWSTTLYPSTVAVNRRKLTVIGVAREQTPRKAVGSVPLPTGDSLARHYIEGSPRPEPPRRRETVERVSEETTPWRERTRAASRRRQQEAEASRSSTPVQDERPPPPPAPEPDPEPELPPEANYPVRPRTVIAGINDYDVVIRTARSLGPGVAFLNTGRRFESALSATGVHLIVVGRVNEDGHGVGDLHYADRRPVIGLQRGDDEMFRVYVGNVAADGDLATALREMKTDATPSIHGPGGVRHLLLGEWFGQQGNGISYRQGWRHWGPPHYVYNSRVGHNEGTELIPTAQVEAVMAEPKDKITITPRFDLTAHGLDTTTAQALALAKPPGPSSCEANALKLGLLGQWAQYGQLDAARHVVLTGQLQVHEPERHIRQDSPVTRFCNNTGRPREDCGGLLCPAFPFMEGWRRGRIRFYASAQCVPTGRRYLVLPTSLENISDFSEAAVFILSFLPWPFANLSLGLETTDKAGSEVINQIFSWYGTTTVIPGDLELDIVLHMSNVGRVASTGRDDEPVLTSRPTTGGTAAEFWPPYSPIPINYRASQDHYIPAATFAVSWALTVTPTTVNTVLQKIAAGGIFDKVDRWVNEAQVLFMSHTGLMATDIAHLASKKLTEDDDDSSRTLNTTAEDDDNVPLLYRCWHPNGSRTQHIPADANWANVRLPSADSIIVPDLFVITQVISGYYNWSKPFGELSIPIDAYILPPTLFVASEKLFVGWHIFHNQIGIPYRGLELGASGRDAGKAESLYYAELFSSNWEPGRNHIQVGAVVVLEKALGGVYLADAAGVPVLHRVLRPLSGRWQPQVWDLEDVSPLDLTCATPMADIVMFKYSDTLPKHMMPFLVSRNLLGNKDYKRDVGPIGGPPDCFYGPYKFKADDIFYRLEPRAMPYVDEREVWQNRLMHAMAEYRVRKYKDGETMEGVPKAGHAPIPYPRDKDAWCGSPLDFDRVGTPYPFFSSLWAGWAEPFTHNVIMLLERGDPKRHWYPLLEQGIGGYADGALFDLDQQPLLFRTPVSGKYSGPDRVAVWTGNVYGGASEKPTKSQTTSGGQSVNVSGRPEQEETKKDDPADPE